jgi:hypothetical protein
LLPFPVLHLIRTKREKIFIMCARCKREGMLVSKKRGKKRIGGNAANAPSEKDAPLIDLSSMMYCQFIGADGTFPATASSLLKGECQDGARAAAARGGQGAQAWEAVSGEEKADEEDEEEDDEADASWTDAQRYHLQCMGVGIGLLALAVLRKRYVGRR